MSPHGYYKLERVIVGEVGRRRCPACQCPLSGSAVLTLCNDRAISVRFTCAWCGHVGGGDVTPTPDLLREAEVLYGPLGRADAGEITADEVLDLHRELESDDWWYRVASR